MSLFRSFSAISRRVPDHLQVISERIYVFDSCLSASMKTEKECKTYLAEVVKSLHSFHPGASVMVFNFREGEQMSLLSDILMNYDIVVVDYPQQYEGYPLLPLEMVHCFLRSCDSWLSLEGQKNVILMHCESGGWPLLAFMLAGLLLFRKQFTGEQKTLDMMYKQAPKKLLSRALSPVNPKASQLRYLQYITQRDSASEWPPSDAPVVIDCLLLKNLPLLDGGKGCRPVVRVYGHDPLAKDSRSAQVLFSSLTKDVPASKYSKEECAFVKLELCCTIQGDVSIECIHLHDDLVTEEIMFKVMFHTGFVQSKLLSLESVNTDIPWNAKLPKEFKAEAIFRDINEVQEHITMELGGCEELHDSENEFFEVDDILIPMTESKERKDVVNLIVPETKLLSKKNKDCTLHNGSPRWDLDTEETSATKKVAPNEENQEVLEPKSDEMETSSKKINVEEIDTISSKEFGLEEGHYLVSEPDSDKRSASSKNIDLEDANAMAMKQVGFGNGNYLISELESEKMSIPSKNIYVEDFDDISSKQNDLDEENYLVSEPESDRMSTSSKNIDVEETSTAILAKQIGLDEGNYLVSEPEYDKLSISSKSIYVEDYDDILSKQIGLGTDNFLVSEPAGYDIMSTSSKNINIDETDVILAKNIGFDEGNFLVSEPKKMSTSSKDIDVEETSVISTKQIGLDEGNYPVLESDKLIILPRNIEAEEIGVISSKQIGLDHENCPVSDTGKMNILSTNNEVEEGGVISSKKIGPKEGNYQVAESDKMIPSSRDISSTNKELEKDGVISSKKIDPNEGNYVVVESDKMITSSRDNDADKSGVISSKVVPTAEGNGQQQVLEAEFSVLRTTSKSIDEVKEMDVVSSKHIAPEKKDHQQVSERDDSNIIASSTPTKNIVVVDSCGSDEIQDVKVEIEPKSVVSIPTKPKQQTTNKKNKWQEITAKTIKQQRVISQWVPRAKTPEATKPKIPVYKWVAKGPTAPTEGVEGEE